MHVMETLPAPDSLIDLRSVSVRPTWGDREHRRWDRLVEEHHYLSFHGVFGKGLRHVAVHGETWLALIGWQSGAFKLAARDRWIGWTSAQQFRRLHLIANNSRFVILTPGRVRNLASRVLGLSLRRLSADMQAVHGFPVLLAETFVDPALFAGTCYRASNWRSLGFTRGFAREPGGAARWRHHGQPKEIFVYELTEGATEALSRSETPPHWGPGNTANRWRRRGCAACSNAWATCPSAAMPGASVIRSGPFWRSRSRPGLPATGA